MSTLSYVMFYGADQHVSRILLTFNDILDYVFSHVCVVYWSGGKHASHRLMVEGVIRVHYFGIDNKTTSFLWTKYEFYYEWK